MSGWECSKLGAVELDIIAGSELQDLCTTVQDVRSMITIDVEICFNIVQVCDAVFDKGLAFTGQDSLVNDSGA